MRSAGITLAMLLLLAAGSSAAPLTYSLGVSAQGLSGTGAPVLRAAAAQSEFILFGEDHGFADSPVLVRAIARDVRPLGFRRLVVEVGPRSTKLVAETLRHSGMPGVGELVHHDPMGLPFLSLKEDAELASDFLDRDVSGTPALIGVDQEFIGSPMFHLERLVAIAPSDAARAEAQRLLAAESDATRSAAQDRFLLTATDDRGFDTLAVLFKGQAEAEGIIADLRESAAIYQAWMHGHNYANNSLRAGLLARNFLAAYHAARELKPKFIFKMGIEHLGLGTTTVNTDDLGTLTEMLARANGTRALRIAFLPIGGKATGFAPKPGNPTEISPYDPAEWGDIFKVIGIDKAQLSTDGWTLIPLEPVRQALDTNGILKLRLESRFLLLGFDYLITTPDAKPATFLY